MSLLLRGLFWAEAVEWSSGSGDHFYCGNCVATVPGSRVGRVPLLSNCGAEAYQNESTRGGRASWVGCLSQLIRGEIRG